MTNYNPFEQFEIIVLMQDALNEVDLSLTNLNATIIMIISLLLISFSILTRSYQYIPHNWQIILELCYTFIYDLVFQQAGLKGVKYFPHLITIFFLILTCNVSGLIPFGFTITSHVVITFSLALSYFLAWIFIGLTELKQKFLLVFCPKNMPYWLLPLLVCVEFLSFFLRPISLGIRLFANMLAVIFFYIF